MRLRSAAQVRYHRPPCARSASRYRQLRLRLSLCFLVRYTGYSVSLLLLLFISFLLPVLRLRLYRLHSFPSSVYDSVHLICSHTTVCLIFVRSHSKQQTADQTSQRARSSLPLHTARSKTVRMPTFFTLVFSSHLRVPSQRQRTALLLPTHSKSKQQRQR